MYQSRILNLFARSYLLLVFLAVVFLCARFAMFQSFVDPQAVVGFQQDVRRMWWIGLRFDLRIAAMAISPLLILGMLSAWHDKSWKLWRNFALGYVPIAVLSVVFLSLSNYFYYQTFHQPFDIFLFGLLEDDTKNVLINIWQDYPLFKAALLSAGLTIVASKAFGWKIKSIPQKKNWPRPQFVSFFLTNILAVFVLARGSVGVFPLDRPNAQVSQIVVLNQLTPNAFMALSWAFEDKSKDYKFEKVKSSEAGELLHEAGLKSLYGQTPANGYISRNPPHVVLAFMESFGSNMLVFDDEKKNDLLGAFRPHFQRDFVFKRFVSYGNGTAPSLAQIFFNSPVHNISQSSARKIKLDTPFWTYKAAGYKTVFVSSGNLMWRNLVNYLPRQGVDEVYDQNALMAHFPEAKGDMTDWGLPDEYAFRFVEDFLQKADKPVFVAILTITNHPPYTTPSHYKPKTVSVSPEYQTRTDDSEDDAKNILKTFQYASNALGEFISKIKKSGLAKKTIIAATGDHSLRRVRAQYPREQMLDKAVPFYLFAPENILNHTQAIYDAQRVGSHKDILPTLYHLSLSNTRYLALGGSNLLSPQDNKAECFGYNETVWIDSLGAYTTTGKSTFYRWADGHSLYLSPEGHRVDISFQKRMRAFERLLRWNLNRQIAGEEKLL